MLKSSLPWDLERSGKLVLWSEHLFCCSNITDHTLATRRNPHIATVKEFLQMCSTHPAPRGAQNSPVDFILNWLMNLISLSAATSGVTAMNMIKFGTQKECDGRITSTLIPELVKADTGSHLCSHKARARKTMSVNAISRGTAQPTAPSPLQSPYPSSQSSTAFPPCSKPFC